MSPIKGEVPQIAWPTITIGQEKLVVRWTFYVQWLLSKRRVPLKDIATIATAKQPELVDTMMEMFAAAVAENYKAVGNPVPSADDWASKIGAMPDPSATWAECCKVVWEAVGKTRPAAPPAPPQAASETTGEPQPTLN